MLCSSPRCQELLAPTTGGAAKVVQSRLVTDVRSPDGLEVSGVGEDGLSQPKREVPEMVQVGQEHMALRNRCEVQGRPPTGIGICALVEGSEAGDPTYSSYPMRSSPQTSARSVWAWPWRP